MIPYYFSSELSDSFIILFFTSAWSKKSNCYWVPQFILWIYFSVSKKKVAILNVFSFLAYLWSAFSQQNETTEWTSSKTGDCIFFARGCAWFSSPEVLRKNNKKIPQQNQKTWQDITAPSHMIAVFSFCSLFSLYILLGFHLLTATVPQRNSSVRQEGEMGGWQRRCCSGLAIHQQTAKQTGYWSPLRGALSNWTRSWQPLLIINQERLLAETRIVLSLSDLATLPRESSSSSLPNQGQFSVCRPSTLYLVSCRNVPSSPSVHWLRPLQASRTWSTSCRSLGL